MSNAVATKGNHARGKGQASDNVEDKLVRWLAREAIRRQWRRKGIRSEGLPATLWVEAQAYLRLHGVELRQEAGRIASGVVEEPSTLLHQ